MAKTQVIGIDKFRTGLALSLTQNRVQMTQGMRRIIDEMASQIKANCPTKTGDLKSTIKVVDGKNKHGPGLEIQVGNSEVNYAAHVEYGTSRAPAHPFVRPVVEVFRQNYPKRMEVLLAETWKDQ